MPFYGVVRFRFDRSGTRVFRTMRFDLAPVKEGAESSGPAQPIRILGDGSIAIPARISRTGCLEYQAEDGTPFIEYRDPAEVFAQESLDSFKGLTLTLLHPDSDVTPDNWRKTSIGHVDSDVREEGIFVACTLIVKDAEAIKRAQSKNPAEWLRELSCGYWADVKLEPGEYEGQKYDGVQTNIRGNHVALGPSEWGRSGPEVKIRVDSKPKGKRDMKYQEMLDLLAKLVADGAITQEQADSIKAALVDPDAEVEEPTTDTDPDKEEKEPDAKADAAKLAASFQRSLVIRDHARVVMGPDFTMPKTDSEIMLAVIRSEDPKFDAKDKEPAYVQARFDMVKRKELSSNDSAPSLAPFVSIFASDSNGEPAKKGTGNPIKDRQNKHYDKMTGKA